ncbi:MAG: hypothetical protein U0930_05420 [Pirellulales bacterium]
MISQRSILQVAILLVAVSSTAEAQLTVLSAGDTSAQWTSAQLSLIDQQLLDQTIKGALRNELESQKVWLNQWNSGQLKAGPWIKQRENTQRMLEPTLDPEKSASALREKLLGKKAKPTTADTQALQKLLEQNPGDLGLQQLYLHWIDQKHYRDEFADKIVSTASTLANELAKVEKQTDDLRHARAYCYYRAARALTHLESREMQAKQPIKDLAQHEAQLLGFYNQLGELVGHDRPEFILLEIRMLRRDHWNGQALMLLEEHAEILETNWYLQHRRDLLNDLGWNPPAKEAETIAANAAAEKVR